MALAIFIITVTIMMISFVVFPKIKIFNKNVDTHWLIVLLGAGLSLVLVKFDFNELKNALLSDNKMNPLKLIILFISMTMLSIYLNEVGFFQKISFWILKKIKSNQVTVFTTFCLLVSVLTIFVSNDVVILTLTPLAIYFAKNAKIKPLPYLFAVLVFSNTFSTVLIIGNPTNVYLATKQSIDFVSYFKMMLIPGLVIGIVSYLILRIVFRKDLGMPLTNDVEDSIVLNKGKLIIGLSHLGICLVLLVLSNVLELEMWLITLAAATSLIISTMVYSIFKKERNQEMIKTIVKSPWSFVPLILGMYILIEGLKQQNVHNDLAAFLNRFDPVYGYGISSFLLSNVMNNLPMSMFYALVIEQVPAASSLGATYASIIGANLGVLLTPFGALAGLMWFDLLKKQGIEVTFSLYFKKLFVLAFATLIVGLLVLKLFL